MKSSVYICAFLVVCLAVSIKAEEKVEWAAVLKKVNEIKTLVANAISKIKTAVEKDNPKVATSLSPKIDDAVKKAQEVLEKAIQGLENKKLSDMEGKKLFAEVQKVFLGVQAEAQPDLPDLKKDTVSEIHMNFLSAYKLANEKAQEAIDLLAKRNADNA